jgi:hypothetical protein
MTAPYKSGLGNSNIDVVLLMGTDMETEKYQIISYIVQLEAQMSLKHSHGKEDIRNHCPS